MRNFKTRFKSCLVLGCMCLASYSLFLSAPVGAVVGVLFSCHPHSCKVMIEGVEHEGICCLGQLSRLWIYTCECGGFGTQVGSPDE